MTFNSIYGITVTMFLKIVKSANKTDYIYVVESYRDEDGNTNHKYLFSLGKLKDFISTPMFKKLAQKALLLDQSLEMGGVDLSCLSEGEVLKYGHFVIKRLWDKFNLDGILGNKINTAKRTRFDIANVVFYMVCKHILEPDSKLGMYESQDKYLKVT